MVQLIDVSPPTEGVRHQQTNTNLDVDGQDFGNGTLFITESCVVWQKESDGLGLNISYPSINCHAVSRDLSFFPHECLHLMVEIEEDPGQLDDGEEEDCGPGVANIRFIPLNTEQLLPMYTAMSQCQQLNPDPVYDEDQHEMFDDIEEDEEDEAEQESYFDSAEGAAHLSAVGRAQLAWLDTILQFGQGDGSSPAGEHNHTKGPTEGSSPAGSDPSDQFQDAEME